MLKGQVKKRLNMILTKTDLILYHSSFVHKFHIPNHGERTVIFQVFQSQARVK